MYGRLNNGTMKKIFMILAVVQMIICSCMKPEIENTQIKTPAAGEVVFTAVIEQTKALPAAGGIVSWTENEEIGVYDGTSYVKATVLGVEGNSITFSAAVDPDAASYVAINPYEAGAAGDGQTINFAAVQAAGKHVVSIALFTDAEETVSFKNVGNLLRFKVNKAAVKKAKIVGNNAEKLAGNVSANAETGEATGTLTVAEIVTDITPGVDNFIALAPGVSLPDGFTITLYGDEDCTDYQGEVSSAAPLDFTGENARNQMRNLGLIDGWIDNYKLWQAGKPITIAGIEYTKESTGLAGTLVSAKDADVDLKDILNGKTGAFFLEASKDKKFITTTPDATKNASLNVCASKTSDNTGVFLMSRYDNAPVLFEPKINFCVMGGRMCMKNIQVDNINNYRAYLFVTYQTIPSALHIDNCDIIVHPGDNILYMNGTQPGVKSAKICNSKIKSTSTARIVIINSSSTYAQWDNVSEIIFDNNVIYSENVDAMVSLVGDNAIATASGNRPTTVAEVTNNTFYNMRGTNTYLFTYSMGSLTVTGNLFYSQSTASNYSHIARSVDSYEYPYVIENNIANYPRMYYFNPYQPGPYKTLGLYVGKTDANFFSKVDTENGIFTQTEAYAAYGAKQ